MKITRIRIYKTDLPYVGGAYVWGAGNVIKIAKASVVVIDTDPGLQGCGEFTPCGETYMIAHSEGVEAFARLAASNLLGEDPRQVAWIEQILDQTVQGRGYAKAPFDAACWDILGQACGQPVWMLLGGKLTDGAPMYRVAPQPMKLDDCVTVISVAQRIVADHGAEICCLKNSNLGGLSKARRVRDLLVEARIPVVAEDTWGGEIASTAVAHFAASTPPDFLQNTTDLMNHNTRSTRVGGACAKAGQLYAPDAPGLGVTADFDSLGAPVAEYAA
ncbi:enolase C-terminal domain-like protein [Pseudooctadecabacter sp.]|uniref:enolase C-terminal domain-like protein n=1 Tax=Pseudooctadecabacter sp. TaxID=1966338 RepID=UPI003F6BA4F6